MQTKNIIFSGLVSGGVAAGILIGAYLLPSPLPFIKSSPLKSGAPLSIGVVDINSIKSDSKIFQKFKEKFDGRNTVIHKEILEQETRLRSEYERLKKLEEQAKEPLPEIIRQKNELNKKLAELENTVHQRREDLYADYSKALVKIKETLKEIMDSLGKAYGVKIILNKSLGDGTQMDQSIVLFCNEGLDLTRQVIDRLDKQMMTKDINN